MSAQGNQRKSYLSLCPCCAERYTGIEHESSSFSLFVTEGYLKELGVIVIH